MYGYTPTPSYDDYLQHGWLKDQAAKAHKYIERWKGKGGRWYYRYKSKAQEEITKRKRIWNHIGADVVTNSDKIGVMTGYDKRGYSRSSAGSTSGYRYHRTKRKDTINGTPPNRPLARKKNYVYGTASVKKKPIVLSNEEAYQRNQKMLRGWHNRNNIRDQANLVNKKRKKK